MKVRIWGTRGSYPVAAAEMLRYGGNTSCVEVRIGDTHIILDAGTGLRPLGYAIAKEGSDPRHFHLLITHTHWDHILGFPFFAPIYHPETHLSIYGLQRTQSSLHTIIKNAVSDPLLPISLERLSADLTFHDINHNVCLDLSQDVRVITAQVNHPYRALGYRVESVSGVLVYIPDTGPFHTVLFGDERVAWNGHAPKLSLTEMHTLSAMRESIIRLAAHADWLIYDTQFTIEQYNRFPHWGHSTPEQAMEIAIEAQVRELLLFHHDPHRADSELDVIGAEQQARAPANLRVRVAYEGMVLSRENIQ
ncbi:MAG: MBL fold metallo-hydrolase [Chloroflexales bacterium]|nr:MBL fold metallo-hydrolase [Chloroflexales bacterium]